MRLGSLFTGIGGFDLAAQWMGWEVVFQVENNDWCNKVLEKNFVKAKRYGDVKDFDGKKYRGSIDVLVGGPPCQPASIAGKRKGTKDNRWLWPEAIRIFGELRPTFAVFENPDDLLTLENGEPFEGICRQMEAFGYKVETYGIPAACVEAWHERDRIWIIAYANDFWNQGRLVDRKNQGKAGGDKTKDTREGKTLDGKRLRVKSNTSSSIATNANLQGLEESTCTELRSIFKKNGASQGCESSGADAERRAYRQIEPGVVRMVHGLPDRVDRIKGLGNTIDPYIAFEIFKAIEMTSPLNQ